MDGRLCEVVMGPDMTLNHHGKKVCSRNFALMLISSGYFEVQKKRKPANSDRFPERQERNTLLNLLSHLIPSCPSLEAKRILGPAPVRQTIIRHLRANAIHVRLIALIRIRVQQLPDTLITLRRQEPRTTRKVVLIRGDQRQDGIQLIIAQPIHTAHALDLILDAINLLRIHQIIFRHLHVGGALAGAAGEVVRLVLEVARLEGDEGHDGGHLLDAEDAVLPHAEGDEGRGLRGGAALGRGAVAGRGLGGDLLDDGGRGELRGCIGREAEEEGGCGSDELHFGGVVLVDCWLVDG